MDIRGLVAGVVSLFLVVPSLSLVTSADSGELGDSGLPISLGDLDFGMIGPFGDTGFLPATVGNNTTDNNIYTIHGTFDPLEGEIPFPEELKYDESNGHYLVQFDGRVRADWISSLESLGAVFYGYVPSNAFVAYLSEEIESNPPDYIRWMGIYHPAYKMLPSVIDKVLDPTNVTVDIFVEVFNDPDEVVSFITSQNGTVYNYSNDFMVAHLNETELLNLSFLDSVRWLDEDIEEMMFNDIATGIIGAPIIWNPPYSLKGSGQTIAILDSGLDTGIDVIGVPDIHLDFNDRVTFFNYWGTAPDDQNGHGTHVAGSAVGNGKP